MPQRSRRFRVQTAPPGFPESTAASIFSSRPSPPAMADSVAQPRLSLAAERSVLTAAKVLAQVRQVRSSPTLLASVVKVLTLAAEEAVALTQVEAAAALTQVAAAVAQVRSAPKLPEQLARLVAE